MTVNELIRMLQQCNPDAEVRVAEIVDDGGPNYWVTIVDSREDEVLIIHQYLFILLLQILRTLWP